MSGEVRPGRNRCRQREASAAFAPQIKLVSLVPSAMQYVYVISGVETAGNGAERGDPTDIGRHW
jgi:hypothetical protein